jgi:glutathione synthase/RimK-type ligase-like ATP-grasp enzyme
VHGGASDLMQRRQQKIDVLIVGNPSDGHSNVVESELAHQGTAFFRISLDTLRSNCLSWTPEGGLTFSSGEERIDVSTTTTVWWRRPGRVSVEDLVREEAQLVTAECIFTLQGTLASMSPRWVDFPKNVELAENKIFQLSVAHRLGIRTPASLLTNVAEKARDFARTRTVVAKARVVTVGDHVFAWRRRRSPGTPVDWREADPQGKGFKSFKPSPELERTARTLGQELSLSTSVQDWLLTETGLVFLEVNPQGQWLFLRNANAIVLPAFIRHLLGEK